MGLRSETNEFSGGPGVNEPQQQGSPAPVAQPNAPVEKIYVGGKSFNSMAELAAYASDLQTKVSQQPAFELKPIEKANTPDVSDLIYTDPKLYTQIVKDDARDEVIGILDKREAVRNLWNNFYSSHKDLEDYKDLVEFQYEKLKKTHGDLPADQALVKVGSEVRAYLNKVRGSHQGGRELPTDPAIVAGASNGAAPTHTTTTVLKDESFIDQVRKFQRRGK